MSTRRWISAFILLGVMEAGIAEAQTLQLPGPPAPGRNPECAPMSPLSAGIPDAYCLRANAPLLRNEKGGTGETGSYEAVPGFFKPSFPAGYTWARVGGIFAEGDRIYVYGSGIVPLEKAQPWSSILRYFNLLAGGIMPAETRREFTLNVFDRKTGKQLDAWHVADPYHGPGSIPHRVRVSPYDPEKHVWVIDEGKPPFDQIMKFTHDGKLVMRVEGKASTSDIAFLPNGDFYALQRTLTDEPIVKYSKDGKEIGRLGPKGATKDAHCIAFDKRGRIYIGEMGGGRVQVFDKDGNSLAIWPNIRVPNYCAMDKDDHLWVFESDSMQFLKFDTDGKLLHHWGTFGYYPGRFLNVNQFDVDSEGNLYTAEPVTWRPQLLRPKQGARKDELIGPLKR